MAIEIVQTLKILGFDVPRFIKTSQVDAEGEENQGRIKISTLTEAQVNELLDEFNHAVLMQVDSYAKKRQTKDNTPKSGTEVGSSAKSNGAKPKAAVAA